MNNSTKAIIALSAIAVIATAVTAVYMFNEHSKLAKSIVVNEKLRLQNEATNFLSLKPQANYLTSIGFKLQGPSEVA
jgi:hypothetical protein